jgi:spermidine synthase
LAAGGIGGFGMAVESVGLLVFQSALGYLYHALGLLVAAFMVGLAWGAAAAGRWAPAQAGERGRAGSARILVAALLTSVLAAVVLPSLFHAVMPVPALAAAAVAVVFLSVGSLAGAIFPIAAALYRGPAVIAATGGLPAAAGALYAAELAGSAGGALLAGALAVPLLGVGGTAYLMALLLLAPLLLCLACLRG